jgi:hypothetical protein
MASHFSTLGLPVQSEEDFVALAQQVGPIAQGLAHPRGAYFHWSDPSGAELWLQVNEANEFTGMNPHYNGAGRMILRLASRVRDPEAGPFDGSFYSWADPDGAVESDDSTPADEVVASGADPAAGVIPFVFDSPEFARLEPLDLPVTLPIQLAAFGHEVEVHESEASFQAAQPADGPLMPVCWIPTGLYRPDGSDSDLPEARVVLSGRIQAATKQTNRLTGREFWAILVATVGGTVDCVVDPQLLNELPVVGGILSGSFWLSGRVVLG